MIEEQKWHERMFYWFFKHTGLKFEIINEMRYKIFWLYIMFWGNVITIVLFIWGYYEQMS